MKSFSEFLKEEAEKPYYKAMIKKLELEYKNYECYPEKEKIWRCFELTEIKNIKVVIIAQDPYHTPGMADGLCFSVNNSKKLPPSLVNIYKEIENDIGKTERRGNLEYLAKQGVLLLNRILTVRKGKPLSHKDIGWLEFTLNFIKEINKKDYIVYLLFGKEAASIKPLLTNPNKLILETSHPSPFSSHKGFLGSRVFSKCNNYLKQHNIEEIKWCIEIKHYLIGV